MTTTTPPSLTDVARQRTAERNSEQIIQQADPATEAPNDVLNRLARKKKPKVQLTPLHVNIPVTLDTALREAMAVKGIEKTELVVAALREVLVDYI